MTEVEFDTTLGSMIFELDEEKAPVSVANFLAYVDSGHYDGTIFHRIIDGFVVQGGGLDETMNPKPTKDPIANESSNGLKNVALSLSMARTMALNSATCQFFINLADNVTGGRVDLDRGQYAVFGRVKSGQDVVQKMAKAKVRNVGPHQDVPVELIKVLKAQRVRA